MWVYYVLIAAILLLGYFCFEHRKSTKWQFAYMLFFGAVFIFLSTVRYHIGYDYTSYKSIFDQIAGSSFTQVMQEGRYQTWLLFAALTKIITLFTNNYMIYLLFFNTFMICSVIRFVWKYSKMPWISLFLFVTLQFFAHYMNLFRQSVAVCVLLFAYGFVIRKKILPAIGITILAGLFHITALIFVPLMVLLLLKSDWRIYVGIGVGALIIYIFLNDIAVFLINNFFTFYKGYTDSMYLQGNGFFYAILPGVIFLCALLFRKKLLAGDNDQNVENRVLINASFYSFIIYFYMSQNYIIERFAIYIYIFTIIFIPQILSTFVVDAPPKAAKDLDHIAKSEKQKILDAKKKIQDQKFYRWWAIGTVLVICIGFQVFSMVKGAHKAYPYVSIFNQQDAVDNNTYFMNHT